MTGQPFFDETLLNVRARRRTHRGVPRAETDVLIAEYLSWLQSRGRVNATIYNYAALLARFSDEVASTTGLFAVSAPAIQAWLEAPRGGRAKGRRGAPATIRRNATIVRSFYSFLVARGYTTSNPADWVATPKIHTRNPRPISDEAWGVLWRYTLGAGDPQNIALLGLGFYCGLRRAEIVALKPANFVGVNVIQQFVRKGGGDDVFPLREVLDVWCDLMPALLPREDRAVFEAALKSISESASLTCISPSGLDVPSGNGKAYMFEGFWHCPGSALRSGHSAPEGAPSPDAVNRRFTALQKASGLPEGGLTPHQMRHSFVTNLLRAGMPLHMVSELANHASVDTTMRYAKIGGGRVAEWRRQVTDLPPPRSIADRFGG